MSNNENDLNILVPLFPIPLNHHLLARTTHFPFCPLLKPSLPACALRTLQTPRSQDPSRQRPHIRFSYYYIHTDIHLESSLDKVNDPLSLLFTHDDEIIIFLVYVRL
jgi:hypothetical protein